MRLFYSTAVALGVALVNAPAHAASTETVLHAFTGSDGSTPGYGQLITDASGALYGTTIGTGGAGSAFKLSPPAPGSTRWTETVLHKFLGGADGENPYGGLAEDASGALYGTTASGGTPGEGGWGTVFTLTPPAPGKTKLTESILYAFQGGADGCEPLDSPLLGADGSLYGTTNGCGASYGTVFKLTPPANGIGAWTETTIYSFGAVGGTQPVAGLIANSSGALYGTTTGGGDAQLTGGVAFRLSPNPDGSWTYLSAACIRRGEERRIVPLCRLDARFQWGSVWDNSGW